MTAQKLLSSRLRVHSSTCNTNESHICGKPLCFTHCPSREQDSIILPLSTQRWQDMLRALNVLWRQNALRTLDVLLDTSRVREGVRRKKMRKRMEPREVFQWLMMPHRTPG
ncbi:unnamed protein product [Gadus morhua 'NCC']